MRSGDKIACILCALTLATACKTEKSSVVYEASWQSLEKVNPVPEWFKDAKFGIYFHWGVYSVPAYANEWYPKSMYSKGSPENIHHIEIYGETDKWPYHNFITGAPDKQGNFVQFAPKLKSEGGNFDPEEWAQLFADAGAKFAGPVAEHHDGFSMWASEVNPWNAKDKGPELDLVRLLTDAIRKKDMKIILSMHHAYNITGFYELVPPTDDPDLKIMYAQQGTEKNEELWLNKHKEIIDNYRPDIIWQDFNLTRISEPVLLQFLAYYYTKASKWNKEVVATYKDALNSKCGVLDFERGGPTDLTDYYWLTDDAISSSSWCYTEGIGYYSKKQVLHGFLDRISKNGNLLLNISPMADGTIPQEQKEILLAMGDWLKKYGEAVYSTRAWERFGEGPTKMGAAHGVFTAPAEGTSKDVRYTRSKDNSTLYAILLGIDPGQEEINLRSLSSYRIDTKTLKSVSLLNGAPGNYISMKFRQDTTGLIVSMPAQPPEELAYVLKLSFQGSIPELNKYVDIDCSSHYYISPAENASLVLGKEGTLSVDPKNPEQQWKFERTGPGVYKIVNRGNPKLVLECSDTRDALPEVKVAGYSGNDNQQWKIEESFNGMITITNKEHTEFLLQILDEIKDGSRAGMMKKDGNKGHDWKLVEVCELKQSPYKPVSLPGTIEAENFDIGCPGDAYFDTDGVNAGGKYRPEEGVDIEDCAAGGFNTGWAKSGEWMAYTVNVAKSGNYTLIIYVATVSDSGKLHIEFDKNDKTGSIPVMNTGGFQNWKTITKNVSLTSGKQIMKICIDEAGSGVNIDKIVFISE